MKILVADEQAVVRTGLISVLGALCQLKIECIEVEDADQVFGVLESGLHLDLVMFDLFLPGADGFELLNKLCARLDGCPVVVFSASEDLADMRKVMESGASGYITKSTDPALMLHAIRLILEGGVYCPAELLQATLGSDTCSLTAAEGSDRSPVVGSAGQPLSQPSPRRPPSVTDLALTHRQLQVLGLIAKGWSNKVIARELELSEYTVKSHVVAILRALGAANRIEAVMFARDLGLDV
ncbi:response regulator transcription factor [Thiohalocapsa marina]|uniref:Response regulator transcription factor n=1 Tax=Thiohalocapsa marina TaxID=424902 RepID=A0A5M8FVH0_9GAMM|nr:response regulator transcription factor [Thiohalocapsa marina]KAA6187796.1 response regulator transcription factor [Thiohalocapsa marina]